MSRPASSASSALPAPQATAAVPPPPPPPGAAASLTALTGVRRHDRDADARLQIRRRPRITCSPRQALIAILILIAALCASLTMLGQQAYHIAALETDAQHTGSETRGSATTESSEAPQSGAEGRRQTPQPVQSAEPDAAAGDQPAPAQTAPPAAAPDSVTGSTADSRVNLNTADLAQLDTLNGVGPVLAQRILDHRQTVGSFTSIDQLLAVEGIGPKTLEKLRAQVRVE